MVLNNEFLKSRNVPDIGSIPISSDDYINESNHIKLEQIDMIMFPEVIPPLQQEFKSWNDKLSHLHPKSMFIIANIVVLP